MQKKDVLTLRIENSLSNELKKMADDFGITRADLIRFILKASLKIDRNIFKEQVEQIYRKHLQEGIKTVFKKEVRET